MAYSTVSHATPSDKRLAISLDDCITDTQGYRSKKKRNKRQRKGRANSPIIMGSTLSKVGCTYGYGCPAFAIYSFYVPVRFQLWGLYSDPLAPEQSENITKNLDDLNKTNSKGGLLNKQELPFKPRPGQHVTQKANQIMDEISLEGFDFDPSLPEQEIKDALLGMLKLRIQRDNGQAFLML